MDDLVDRLRKCANGVGNLKTDHGDFGLCDDAADEIERLRNGLEAIRQYGSDTLRGPSDRADDTREWQRDGVLELTNRAVRVLSGRSWLESESEEQSDG